MLKALKRKSRDYNISSPLTRLQMLLAAIMERLWECDLVQQALPTAKQV
jgi:hypothetical protein